MRVATVSLDGIAPASSWIELPPATQALVAKFLVAGNLSKPHGAKVAFAN